MTVASHESAPADEQLDRVFRALGDKTRRRLLSTLARGSAKVTELARPFDMSLPAVGKHLRVLENAGLVRRTINGRVHQCSLDPSPLKSVEEWLADYEQFWNETLTAMADYLQAPRDGEP